MSVRVRGTCELSASVAPWSKKTPSALLLPVRRACLPSMLSIVE